MICRGSRHCGRFSFQTEPIQFFLSTPLPRASASVFRKTEAEYHTAASGYCPFRNAGKSAPALPS